MNELFEAMSNKMNAVDVLYVESREKYSEIENIGLILFKKEGGDVVEIASLNKKSDEETYSIECDKDVLSRSGLYQSGITDVKCRFATLFERLFLFNSIYDKHLENIIGNEVLDLSLCENKSHL